MKEETRKEIRQKMADYRQPAPEVSWDVLEKALAGNKPARKVALWPKRVAAAPGLASTETGRQEPGRGGNGTGTESYWGSNGRTE